MIKEYFASVFTEEKDVEARELGEINRDILKDVHITEEEVLDILKCIKVDKSLGPAQVYPQTLWEAGEVIAGPLAEAFESLIATGKVPEDWKLANVVPLFKKDGKDKPENYNSLSLGSVVGTLLEGILRDRIYMYLEWRGLVRDNQHGFVRGRLRFTNLIELFEEVTKRIDEGRVVDVIYMDFSETFNNILQ
eukprot:g29989.t1